jgi:hypothetical protein
MTHEERLALIYRPVSFELSTARKGHAPGAKKPTLGQLERDGGVW